MNDSDGQLLGELLNKHRAILSQIRVLRKTETNQRNQTMNSEEIQQTETIKPDAATKQTHSERMTDVAKKFWAKFKTHEERSAYMKERLGKARAKKAKKNQKATASPLLKEIASPAHTRDAEAFLSEISRFVLHLHMLMVPRGGSPGQRRLNCREVAQRMMRDKVSELKTQWVSMGDEEKG